MTTTVQSESLYQPQGRGKWVQPWDFLREPQEMVTLRRAFGGSEQVPRPPFGSGRPPHSVSNQHPTGETKPENDQKQITTAVQSELPCQPQGRQKWAQPWDFLREPQEMVTLRRALGGSEQVPRPPFGSGRPPHSVTAHFWRPGGGNQNQFNRITYIIFVIERS